MWLSTNEGLGIYNGYYYRKMINPNDSNDKPLSKRILTLYEDKDGFLWIGYQDSIGFTGFDYETKHFTHFKPDKSNKDIFAKEFIPSQFYQDLENQIWIATWGEGLLQYNKITKKLKCYNTETKFTNNAKIVCATVRTIFELEQKEIVDSIIYVRRIQNALLASKSLLNKHLKNYFIYFNPKELVSGDFYWATALNNKFYFMIGDSTGHGVPGAFMSLLNINFLNEAINEKGIEKTNEILNYVRNKLILSLAEDGSQDGGKDGMDCSLLCFDFEKMVLEFACANNPVIIISNGGLTEYKADRMPVGKSPKDEIQFTSTKVKLNSRRRDLRFNRRLC